MNFPLLLQCSPRLNGNSAFAASLAAKTISGLFPGQPPPEPLNLCSYTITPCIGCDICAVPKSHTKFFLGCPLSHNDDSVKIFTMLLQAPAVFFFSPIYHYHLPAQCKALLDRLQPFYWMHQCKTPFPEVYTPKKHYFALLVAGQTKGQKLFEGSRLSLRYSFQALDYQHGQCLGLRNIDGKQDLRNNPAARKKTEAFILRALETIYPALSASEGT